MCGIVGYIGKKQAAPVLLDGLSKLEYRGYDSAGMAVYDGKKIQVQKAAGRLKVLDEQTHNGNAMQGLSESGIPGGQRTARRAMSMHTRITARMRRLRLCTMELLKIT